MSKGSASSFPSMVLLFMIMVQLTSVSLLARDKTDVVILKNGDRLTGEIKQLERGKMRLSTDYMGTVEIEWPGIERVSSEYVFEFENQNGRRLFGTLRPTLGPDIEIVGEQSSVTLDLLSVVRMTPIENSFLARLEGYLDVGFSFTRANRATEWNLGAEVESRNEKRSIRLKLSSLFNGRQDLEATSRNVAGLEFWRVFGNRWSAGVLGQFTQNEELELDLRSSIGGGLGRHLIQTNRSTLSLNGGLIFNRERFTGSDPGRNSAEAFGAVQLDMFTFDDPEMDISTTFAIFPNLNNRGRYRMDLESRIRYEIFKDFFFSVSLFDNFDSDPPSVEAEKNDFGVSTSLGWSF